MGAICGVAAKILSDQQLAPDENDDDDYADGVPTTAKGGSVNVYMLIIALDYPGTGNELTCSKDGENMAALFQACGLPDSNMIQLYNNDGNKDRVLQSIQDLGGRCQAGDYFIFYYSGHGTSVPDKDGDEDDGKDEALCLVTPEGKLDWNAFLTDDEFAQAMSDSVSDDVRTIILSDCCHSGTISDFDSSDAWGEILAVSMSGCADDQTSGDTGNGGIFTHSMLMAIADHCKNGNTSYSVGQLYNKTLEFDDEVFASKQDIKCARSEALQSSTSMAWPLVPDDYTAPWSN